MEGNVNIGGKKAGPESLMKLCKLSWMTLETFNKWRVLEYIFKTIPPQGPKSILNNDRPFLPLSKIQVHIAAPLFFFFKPPHPVVTSLCTYHFRNEVKWTQTVCAMSNILHPLNLYTPNMWRLGRFLVVWSN